MLKLKLIRNIIKTHYSISTQALNVRTALVDPISAQKLDDNLNKYPIVFAALLHKRRILRSEIWPKIKIIEQLSTIQMHHLNYQKLYPLKKSIKDELMLKLVHKSPELINSAYIISIFCQDYFKQMLDQYLLKILVCGKCAENQKQQQILQEQINQLYRIFYYGQKNTPLEREIQLKYLSLKQQKYQNYTTQIKADKLNAYNRCKWTQQNQRIVEGMLNWHKTDLNMTDINLRSFFQPLSIKSRKQSVQQLYTSLLGGIKWYQKLLFNWFIGSQYESSSPKYYKWIAQILFIRVIHWIKSIEFTYLMKIPPDFLIEMSILHIHYWLLINQLNQINTRQSRYISKQLQRKVIYYMKNSTFGLHIKKKDLLINHLLKIVQNNTVALNVHFNRSNITKNNHYKGIDALVWTIAFAQKEDRYGDNVYLFSQYLIRNFQHIKHHTLEDLIDGILQFDVFLIHPKYQQLITYVNQPLSPEQFQQELNCDRLDKKYYYSYIQKDVKFLQNIIKINQQKLSFKWIDLFNPFIRTIKKYNNLDNYDHYSKMDQEQKKNYQKNKNSPWNTQQDKIKNLNKEFVEIEKKKIKKKINNKQMK